MDASKPRIPAIAAQIAELAKSSRSGSRQDASISSTVSPRIAGTTGVAGATGVGIGAELIQLTRTGSVLEGVEAERNLPPRRGPACWSAGRQGFCNPGA